MGKNASGRPDERRMSVKGPLIFSAVLAVIAGFLTMVFATGGSGNLLRWDLGVTAAGIAFIACLLVVAVLTMSTKENPSHLSEGSGIHRVSSKIPGGAGTVPAPGTPQSRAQVEEQQAAEDRANPDQAANRLSHNDDDDGGAAR